MSDALLADLFGDLRRARDEVRERTSTSRRYRFGARDLLVHAESDISALIPPGALRVADPATSAPATVDLYVLTAEEAASVRVPRVALAPYGAVRESEGGEWLVLLNPESGRLLALDTAGGCALYYPGYPNPPRDRAEFARPLLHWLAVRDGGVVIHAGAVERDGRALLVAGTGNAGKSTLIRACLAAGFRMLGDNVVEVTHAAQGPSAVFGVYPTVKVRPDPVVPIAGGWPEPLWDDEAQKHIYLLADVLGDSFCDEGTALAAFIVLDENGPPTPHPLSLAAAVFRVAPNTVGQFPLFEREVLERTGALLSRHEASWAGRMPPAELPAAAAALLAPAERRKLTA